MPRLRQPGQHGDLYAKTDVRLPAHLTPHQRELFEELRRIRRLTDLGVNLAGAEIILRMRRRIEELQIEIARLQTLLDASGSVRER